MLFNSLQFFVFFFILYCLYLLSNHKLQNRLLLIGSYIFYGTWDWRFLSLIFISTALDYICGLKIYNSKDIKRKKLFLFFSIFGNLSILGFFKYFNFFAANLQTLLGRFGFTVQPQFLHIILPVGISFYTFQTMSYTIDIYRKEMEPTRKFFDFALFVAFFPQLVAGPIERAKHLLPQVINPRSLNFNKFYEGCHLILWGLLLKVFVADNLALIVNPVFANTQSYNGVTILISLYAFAFQIFCDFAGYSNIARGLGKCMGFDIMVNFNLPYFATNPREFWRRWHISLSSWLKDYLYIPLGGNRKGASKTYRNIMITMILGGLWHGANWTFILWGVYHGLLISGHRLLQPILEKAPSPKTRIMQRIWIGTKIIFFFHLVCFGWLIFRAESLTQMYRMLKNLIFNFRFLPGIGIQHYSITLISCIAFLVVIQVLQYLKNDLLIIRKANPFARTAFYYICFLLIMLFGVMKQNEFIYFQF